MDFITQKGKYQALYSKVYKEKTEYLRFIMNRLQDGFVEIIVDDKMIYEKIKKHLPRMKICFVCLIYRQALKKYYSLSTDISVASSSLPGSSRNIGNCHLATRWRREKVNRNAYFSL